MNEIWKDVIGYEGIYQVSNLGNVKRIIDSNNQFKSNHVLKFNIIKGYCHVQLHKNSTCKCFRVHRLVASSFIPNLDNKPHVNHINGIKDDNRVENLEWCTPSENELHKHRVLGKTHYKYNYTESQKEEIVLMYKNGCRIKEIAFKFNTTVDSIHKMLVKIVGKVNYSGQYNGASKLKDSDINLIKELRNNGMHYSEIALKFNVSANTIYRRFKSINQ